METKKIPKRRVIRTLSIKYQLTIPKRFGEDLGLEPLTPVTVTEDVDKKRLIIEPLMISMPGKAQQKKAFINACRILGKKWAKLGVTQADVQAAIRQVIKKP